MRSLDPDSMMELADGRADLVAGTDHCPGRDRLQEDLGVGPCHCGVHPFDQCTGIRRDALEAVLTDSTERKPLLSGPECVSR